MIKLAYITTLPETQLAFLDGQNKHLASRGFELHSISTPGRYADELVARDPVTFHPVKIHRRIRPLADLLTLIRLFLVLRRIRPQICHVSTSKGAVLGATAAWLARVPVRVFLVRGLASENARGWRRRLFRFLEWFTAKICHETICVAPSLLEFARTQRIIPPSKGAVVANGMSNGVNVQHFNPETVEPQDLTKLWQMADADTKVIAFLGRLDRDKGIEEIAAMWQRIRYENKNSVLLLVGRWESHEADNQSVRDQFEHDDRVILTGWVEDVAPYLAASTVVVMPTHGTEGFPNVPMQAASMAIPVIGTTVVGCVDAIVPEVTGTLIPPRDATALTDSVRGYLQNPELAARHGNAARTRVLQKFRREAIWRGMEKVYRRLLGTPDDANWDLTRSTGEKTPTPN